MFQFYTTCKIGPSNPFQGAVSFDNIGLAWVAIFVVRLIYNIIKPIMIPIPKVISLEGWTDVMYIIQDVHSFYNFIYFVILIIVGTFFMVNLCLVVIANQFSETRRRETAKMKEEREQFSSDSSLSSFPER